MFQSLADIRVPWESPGSCVPAKVIGQRHLDSSRNSNSLLGKMHFEAGERLDVSCSHVKGQGLG